VGTEEHRGSPERIYPVFPVVPRGRRFFDDSDSKFARRCDVCRQGPPAGQEERHHGRGGRRAEIGPDRASGGRQSQRGMRRIFREAFERTAILRYYCAGLTGRNKVIRVAGLSAAQVRERLGI